MATSEHSLHFVQYVGLLTQLHELVRQGKGDTPEADALRDQMDEPWGHLTEEEIAQARLLSADMSLGYASTASVWAPAEAPRVFLSYSRKDEFLRNELERHLQMLQRRGLIQLWHDRLVAVGSTWKSQIDENLERADVIVLLLSADFLASHYCCEIEMTRALERHAARQARVIPGIVRECAWHETPLGKLQALPTDGKAVTTWPERDSAWRNVAGGIEKVLGDLPAAASRVPSPRSSHRG